MLQKICWTFLNHMGWTGSRSFLVSGNAQEAKVQRKGSSHKPLTWEQDPVPITSCTLNLGNRTPGISCRIGGEKEVKAKMQRWHVKL